MFSDSWWQRIFNNFRLAPARRKKAGRRVQLLDVELLEDRRLPSFAITANIDIYVTGSVTTQISFTDPNRFNDGSVSALHEIGASNKFVAANLRSAVADVAAFGGSNTIFLETNTYNLTNGELLVEFSPQISLTIKNTSGGSDYSTITRATDSTFRLFEIHEGGTVKMDNLILTNGAVSGPSNAPAEGGAILNEGSLTLSNDQLTDNTAAGYGGEESSPQDGDGGGVYNLGTLIITGAIFESNSARGGEGINGNNGANGAGGGVYNLGSLSITGTLLESNTAAGGESDSDTGGNAAGGAIYLGTESATASITGSTFTDNFANGAYGGNAGGSGYGGAIELAQTGIRLNIYNSTFNGNRANGGGANDAYGGGGGADGAAIAALAPVSGTSKLTIVNSTFADNIAYGGNAAYGGASFGGAILAEADTTVTLVNDTIALNQVFGGESFNDPDTSAGGGGVANAGGTVTVVNTIIAENQSQVSFIGSLNADDVNGAFNSLGHNFIGTANNAAGFTGPGDQAGSGTGGDTVLNPGLDPGGLQSNGGPTQTIALLATSPAINTGDTHVVTAHSSLLNSLGIAPLSTDQRGTGFPREVDGGVDIGAFQFQMNLDKVYSIHASTSTATTLTVTAPGLLLGASAFPLPDGESYEVELVGSPPGQGTTLVLNSNGSFTFTVPKGFNKTVVFEFRVIVLTGDTPIPTNLIFTATIGATCSGPR